jgi:hypothetical protein
MGCVALAGDQCRCLRCWDRRPPPQTRHFWQWFLLLGEALRLVAPECGSNRRPTTSFRMLRGDGGRGPSGMEPDPSKPFRLQPPGAHAALEGFRNRGQSSILPGASYIPSTAEQGAQVCSPLPILPIIWPSQPPVPEPWCEEAGLPHLRPRQAIKSAPCMHGRKQSQPLGAFRTGQAAAAAQKVTPESLLASAWPTAQPKGTALRRKKKQSAASAHTRHS